MRSQRVPSGIDVPTNELSSSLFLPQQAALRGIQTGGSPGSGITKAESPLIVDHHPPSHSFSDHQLSSSLGSTRLPPSTLQQQFSPSSAAPPPTSSLPPPNSQLPMMISSLGRIERKQTNSVESIGVHNEDNQNKGEVYDGWLVMFILPVST